MNFLDGPKSPSKMELNQQGRWHDAGGTIHVQNSGFGFISELLILFKDKGYQKNKNSVYGLGVPLF